MKSLLPSAQNVQEYYWERANRNRSPMHPVVSKMVEHRLLFIKRYINLVPNMRILDVGCGNGYFTYWLGKNSSTFGVDMSWGMLAQNPSNELIQSNALELPFEDNTFDVAFESALLHHIAYPERVVSEMARVTKRYVVLIEPNRNNPMVFLYCLLRAIERWGLRFNIDYMSLLLEQVDLTPVVVRSMGVLVPHMVPLKFLPMLERLDRNINWGGVHVIAIGQIM